MAPRDEAALVQALATCLSLEGPSAFRYPRGAGVGVKIPDPEPWENGTGELLREGADALVIGVGSTVHPCLTAAEALEREGISVAVIDARFVKPLDTDLILSWARECSVTLTVEENVLQGGFGSAVVEAVNDSGEDLTVHRLGLPDSYVEQASLKELRAELKIDAEGIVAAVKEALSGGRLQKG
jgi:1-deoxy-D-xylulose-5-phosphate synthase